MNKNTRTLKIKDKSGKNKPTHHKSIKKFKKNTCSPLSNNKFTCYNDKSLSNMKMLWNKRRPDSKIESNNPKEIWNHLKESMKNVCNNEQCWLKQQFMDNNLTTDLTLYTFAPDAPEKWLKNPNEWLNSNDIIKVMKQYEHKHDNFDFIGPTPIDFDEVINGICVWPELCKFNLIKQIKKNKTKIGVIFNLDKHDMGGSHWLTLYVDVKKKIILFFNSTGEKPTTEVKALIERIITQAKSINLDFEYLENKKNHQRKNTECGIYCLYCITELLENNKEPEYFLTHRIPDKKMEELRYTFFNEYNNDE
tara:strand:+ start:34 stop:954 length:921 start_codon:yes stop_codon:yes gene_type:complete